MSDAIKLESLAAEPRFKPYPAYKDSGVEWLEQIPEHWEVNRLKYLARLNPESLGEDTDPALEMIYVDIGGVNSLGRLVEKEPLTFGAAPSRARRVVREGDVIVSTVRTYLRAIAAIREPGPGTIVSTGFAVVRPDDHLTTTFASYALRAPYFVERVVANSKGVSFPAINESEMATFELARPPAAEQRAIGAFLDRETAKLDALVAKKERLIKLLQERRGALITRAVTKGLYPNVPMKDSGFEWLGAIPANWEVLKLKRRSRRIQTGTTPPTSETKYYEDGTIPWYGPGSFADALPLQDPVKFIAASAVREGVARLFDQGSAVIVTIGATLGKVAYMEVAGSCNQQITGVTFDQTRVYPKYGVYQLKSLEPALRGVAPNTTLPILDQEEVGYLPFVVPPEGEQRSISAFLDWETAKIDRLTAKVEEAIDRLKELRTALISAAVTGKIDVREEVA
jgi:type I restriction enzyme S subunit